MKSFTHVLSVHIIRDVVAKNDVVLSLKDVCGPGSIFAHGHTSLVGFVYIFYERLANTVFRLEEGAIIDISVKVVPVE